MKRRDQGVGLGNFVDAEDPLGVAGGGLFW
jgi:hypothetical protein